MAIPSGEDIKKKATFFRQMESKLDENGRIVEKYAVSQLRSAIRQVWMRAPNKLAVLERARVPDMNPSTRTKWLFECAICGGMFKQADVEVDHIHGNNSFTKVEDFQSYWDNVLNVSTSELQVICKFDHSIKTYQEAHNLTWEEAVARKKVIAKMKQKAPAQKKELLSYGFTSKEVATADKRESCYVKLLEEGKL